MSLLGAYLSDCRAAVLETIRGFLPKEPDYHRVLYGLMLDYPLREAKALRPALCIATCRALGGQLESVLPSAAAIEFFHNAFLVHDDIEDESELRRGAPTLHHAHGVPIAVNVGDAMLALALGPLLANTRLIGLGKALRVLETVERMCRESVEGQALELDWMHEGAWDLDEHDYVRMVRKKTSYYTFVAPVRVGGLVAGCPPERLEQLADFAMSLGVAFQIQDDVLNLDAGAAGYGKELAGDLWEGKRTLMLLHALRCATDDERARALSVLAKGRPAEGAPGGDGALALAVEELLGGSDLSPAARQRLSAALGARRRRWKTREDVAFLSALIMRHDGLGYAREVARRFGDDAQARLGACAGFLPPSVHREFLESLVDYVQTRER